jgi:hypothetical protein
MRTSPLSFIKIIIIGLTPVLMCFILLCASQNPICSFQISWHYASASWLLRSGHISISGNCCHHLNLSPKNSSVAMWCHWEMETLGGGQAMRTPSEWVKPLEKWLHAFFGLLRFCLLFWEDTAFLPSRGCGLSPNKCTCSILNVDFTVS